MGRKWLALPSRGLCLHGGIAEIVASVDEVNIASRRVLEKLGFEPTSTRPGSFGNLLVLRLSGL